MKKVLFLCTGNSCRSQMAEGWARLFFGDAIEVYSAGTDPYGIDSRAVAVMSEAGVDISAQRSEHVEELTGISFDLIVTVCDSAKESCPVFPGEGRMVHQSFQDPPAMAYGEVSEKEALDNYRKVRDEIRDFVKKLRF